MILIIKLMKYEINIHEIMKLIINDKINKHPLFQSRQVTF